MSSAIAYNFSALVPVFTIEKLGRKPLLIAGAFGQAACMLVLGACLEVTHPVSGYIAAVAVFGFTFIFGCGKKNDSFKYIFETVFEDHVLLMLCLFYFIFRSASICILQHGYV